MLKPPNLSTAQLIVVARMAGAPIRKTRLNAELAAFFFASSALPERESFNGLIEQTYPDMIKKIATERYPPCTKRRKYGIVRI